MDELRTFYLMYDDLNKPDEITELSKEQFEKQTNDADLTTRYMWWDKPERNVVCHVLLLNCDDPTIAYVYTMVRDWYLDSLTEREVLRLHYEIAYSILRKVETGRAVAGEVFHFSQLDERARSAALVSIRNRGINPRSWGNVWNEAKWYQRLFGNMFIRQH